MLGIRIRIVALLLSIMIFMWFWMIHIPAGIKYPLFERGNLLASAFDALAFSASAFLIALTMPKQKWISDLKRRKKAAQDRHKDFAANKYERSL
jgi:uncharacterized membrane protein YphA (DoxX/SURF4 family)